MYVTEDFNSIQSFVSAMNSREICKDAGDSSIKGTAGFTSTRNYDEACHLAMYGDMYNAKKVEMAIKRLQGGQTGHEERAHACVKRDVVGSSPCVPAAVMGHPNAMYRRHVVRTIRPVVNVYYNTSVSCTVNADDIIEFGAKLVTALKTVERSGVRVNVYVGAFLKDNDERVATFVRVKDSDHDLDALRMAYPIVNPSLLRRHIFRFIETSPKLTQTRWKYGYGRVVEGSSEQEFWKRMNKKNSVLVSFTKDGKLTSEEIARNILAVK